MISLVRQRIEAAVSGLTAAGKLRPGDLLAYACAAPDVEEHGDLATNVAMANAPTWRVAPKQSAAMIAEALRADPMFERVDVAGPGFVNLFLSGQGRGQLLAQLTEWTRQSMPAVATAPKRILVEYVSANPTGPLHVGHGRNAVFGDSLARLLRRVGHTVETEYYINDLGRQMNHLGQSLKARLHQRLGREMALPEDGYKGQYMVELADSVLVRHGPAVADLPDAAYVDLAKDAILEGIRADLQTCRVTFDHWFSERTLAEKNLVDEALTDLRARDEAYESEGALWFRSTKYGDEKDRVLVRSNGERTYFASDVAYHRQKLQRGYDVLIDIWGSDHHGYIPRLKASIDALGASSDRLEIILIQFVTLVRAGQAVSMSTRSGEFETFERLLKEVGVDATRFQYLTRRPDSHLDFDVELAVKQSNENPVYYVQYAHARACSVFGKSGVEVGAVPVRTSMAPTIGHEKRLLLRLCNYRETLLRAAALREPHLIIFFLRELAADFHKFYAVAPILQAEPSEREMRLLLVECTRSVIEDGLKIVGVEAPESM